MCELFKDLPDKKYNSLVVDVPWTIKKIGKTKHLAGHKNHNQTRPVPYKMLSIEEIKQFPIMDLANVGAHIYFWATNATLRVAFDILEFWGIHYHLTMPLVKKSGVAPSMGYVFGAEYCLLGFAGKPMQKFKNVGKLNWLVTSPKPRTHSKKPDEFYELVELMSPDPYIDIFSRQVRNKWDSWGDGVVQNPPN